MTAGLPIDMDTMRQACALLDQTRKNGDIGGNAYNSAASTILTQASRPLPRSMRGIYVLPNGCNSMNEMRTVDSWVYHLTHKAP
jgi:hypothetical protein